MIFIKNTELTFLAFLMFCLSGCADKNNPDSSNRTTQFVGDYAEYVVLDIKTAKNGQFQNREFSKKHEMRNTKKVVDGMVLDLKRSKTTNAYANVFEKSDGGYQCIIVHKADVSESVLDHERGHCFRRLFMKEIISKAPQLKKAYLGSDEYSVYIGESFAEVAAATRAYSIDGDFSYLVNRLEEIQGKASFLNAYKACVPLLLLLKEHLLSENKLSKKPEKQIKSIITDFYLEHVLSRQDFEERNWWSWIK